MPAVATFTCPLCGVLIPLDATDKPTPEGLTVSLDTEIYMEHAVMHADCECQWTRNTEGTGAVITQVHPNCRFHAA